MKKDCYKNFSVVFYDFHFLNEGDYPPGAEPIFCFLVLKDGSLTSAHWHQFLNKEEHGGVIGEFVRGLADAVPLDQVHAWLNLEKWGFDKPEKGDEYDILTIGAKKDYSIEVTGFHPISKKSLPQDEQYCLLMLNDGKMSGGRWSDGGPYMEAPGYFDHAAGGSIIDVDEVWLWAALDPDKDVVPEKEPPKRKKPEAKAPVEEKPPKQPEKPSPKRFKYGLDLEVYLDKAVEELKKNYAWVTRDDLDPRYRYAIEEENGTFQFFEYYKDDKAKKSPKGKGKGRKKGNNNEEERSPVTDCFFNSVDADGFIHRIVFHNESYVLSKNKVVARHKVRFRHTRVAGGWHLEHYIFMKRASGDYTVDVQAGDMNTGANREFGIPRKCFEAPTFELFLDEYEKTVPGDFFGLSKEELLADANLKEFLGYTE